MSAKKATKDALYKTKSNSGFRKLLNFYFHSFALTDTAYRSLAKENRDQCILISGKKSRFYFEFCIIPLCYSFLLSIAFSYIFVFFFKVNRDPEKRRRPRRSWSLSRLLPGIKNRWKR